MKKLKSRAKKSAGPPEPREAVKADRVVKRQSTPPDDVHDAGHPGGLPDLDAKTDWEAEHDTWWRHE
jgi:hypothetical protein